MKEGRVLRSAMGAFLACCVAGAVIFDGGGATAAPAGPTPDSGPTSGGTTVAVSIPQGMRFTRVDAGYYSPMLAGADGNFYSWGTNTFGQFGDASTANSNVPVPVQLPGGVTFTQLSTDGTAAAAIGSDGNTYAWGNNSSGQLGNGSDPNTTSRSLVPVPVTLPPSVTFTKVSAGGALALASGSDGNAYAWGRNDYGQLGIGTTTGSETLPQKVKAPPGVTFTQFSQGSFFSVALDSDGNAYAWGANESGQLGNDDSTHTSSNVPVKVKMPNGVTFTQISADSFSVVAIGSDGHTYAWGRNTTGQLGVGDQAGRDAPAQVQEPNGVTFTQISAGYLAVLAIGSDGQTYAWGYNLHGQLGTGEIDGNGNNLDSDVPVKVKAPEGVTFTQVSTDGESLAIGSDGNVYAWGSNVYGQLGTGTRTESNVPVKVPPIMVTGVTFDGIPGTGLSENVDSSMSVVTPAHAAGAVDVVVEWTLAGVVQTPVTYPRGFTYAAPAGVAPQVTSADHTTGQAGKPLTEFTYAASGTPATMTWSTPGATTGAVAPGTDRIPKGLTLDGAAGTLSGTIDPSVAPGDYAFTVQAENGVPPAGTQTFTVTVTAAGVAPTVSNPADQRVAVGGTATFTVQTTGVPAPTVTWEVSTDGGKTWQDSTADPAAKLSGDGLTLTVTDAPAGHDGYQYRATATNSQGAQTSGSAKLTVADSHGSDSTSDAKGSDSDSAAKGSGSDSDSDSDSSSSGSTAGSATRANGSTDGSSGSGVGGNAKGNDSLATTGAGSILPFAITGGIILLLAGAVVVTVRVRARRHGPMY